MSRREEVEVDNSRRWLAWKAAGVLLLLVLLYWAVRGGSSWFRWPSGTTRPTARLSQTGELCVKEALPTSASCGVGCGAAMFQKVGLNFSCWGGQVAVLPDLRPNIPTTFMFPGGNITLRFPAVDVEVPLVQTEVIPTAKLSTPEVIAPPVRPLPTPQVTPQTLEPPVIVTPPIKVLPRVKVLPPVKRAPASIVRQTIQIRSTCSIALSFTVSAMFASSSCFNGTVAWGERGSAWHSMQARQIGPWYESNLLPSAGARICFRVNKKVFCASNVEAGGTYTFTEVP